jgi:hypothetical protein
MQFAVKSIWETELSTLLLSCAIVLALRMRGIGETDVANGPQLRDWMLLGFLSGLLALSNPSTLLFLSACGVWILWPAKKNRVGGAVLAVAICVAMVTPWMVRNALVFHHFIPMRTNAGAEFYLGNGPGATGLVMEFDHPFFNADALASYRQLGELRYSQQQGAVAWAGVHQQPVRFATLVARRIYFFWCGVPHETERRWDRALTDWFRMALFTFTSAAGIRGLALAWRRRIPAAPIYLSAFVLLPAVYYFVFVHARFRHPLEPLLAVLGAWLFQQAGVSGRASAKIKAVGA